MHLETKTTGASAGVASITSVLSPCSEIPAMPSVSDPSNVCASDLMLAVSGSVWSRVACSTTRTLPVVGRESSKFRATAPGNAAIVDWRDLCAIGVAGIVVGT